MRQGYLVKGRVQGVGFRWWTERAARRIGVSGTVRNTDDGDVEVMAEGSEEELVQLEAALERGPPLSSVTAVIRIACSLPEGVSGFTILR